MNFLKPNCTALLTLMIFFTMPHYLFSQNISTNNTFFLEQNRRLQISSDSSNLFFQNNAYQLVPETIEEMILSEGGVSNSKLPFQYAFLTLNKSPNSYSSQIIYPEVNRMINNMGIL